jgi:hypothetical protein
MIRAIGLRRESLVKHRFPGPQRSPVILKPVLLFIIRS